MAPETAHSDGVPSAKVVIPLLTSNAAFVADQLIRKMLYYWEHDVRILTDWNW